MKRVVFLTPSSAWPGFGLAGMDQVPTTKQAVEEQLIAQVNDPETGLVVLDERLMEGLSEQLLGHLDHKHPGKITLLPSPVMEETGYALDVIRQAIGYHVRIKG